MTGQVVNKSDYSQTIFSRQEPNDGQELSLRRQGINRAVTSIIGSGDADEISAGVTRLVHCLKDLSADAATIRNLQETREQTF